MTQTTAQLCDSILCVCVYSYVWTEYIFRQNRKAFSITTASYMLVCWDVKHLSSDSRASRSHIFHSPFLSGSSLCWG